MIAEELKATHGIHFLEETDFRGEKTLRVALSSLELILKLACDKGFNFLLDITSLDHLETSPRFELVYELATLDDKQHLRIKVAIDIGESAPSVVSIWKTANWHEREIFDMMGIKFSGHPNLTRILMWEGYTEFPLRKDFPLSGNQTHVANVAFTKAAPQVGGPFVSTPGAKGKAAEEPTSKGED